MGRGEPRPRGVGVTAGTCGCKLALTECGWRVVMPGSVRGARPVTPKEGDDAKWVTPAINGDDVDTDRGGAA